MADQHGNWRSKPAAEPYLATIDELEKAHGMPAGLLGKLVDRESNFDPNAKSSAGAVGLVQLMPIHSKVDRTDAMASLSYGAQYLTQLKKRFGTWDKALAAYNWGEGNLSKALRKHGPQWMTRLPKETSAYVAALAPAEKYTNGVLDVDDDAGLAMPDRKAALQDRIERAQQKQTEEAVDVAETKAALREAAANKPAPKEDYGPTGYWAGVGERAYDAGKAVVRGVSSAAQEAMNLVGELADELPSELDGGFEWKDGGFRLIGGDEWRQRKAAGTAGMEHIDLPKPDAPETVLGDLTKGVSQFLAGFLTGGKVLKGLGWANGGTKLLTASRMVTQGAFADAVAFDAHEERLSNMIQGTSYANAVTEYLAAKEDDGALEGRMKNAIEGAGLGLVADSIIKGIKLVKFGRFFKTVEAEAKAGAEEAHAIKVTEPVAPKVDDVAAKLDEQPAPGTGKTVSEVADPVREFDPQSIRSRIVIESAQVEKAADDMLQSPTVTMDTLSDFNVKKFDLNFDAVEDANHIRSILQTTSDVFQEVIEKAKGGVQPHKVTARLATLVGTSAERVHKLFAEVRGKNGLAARILAAEQTLLASARNVKKLADAARKSGSSPESMLAFHKAVRVHAIIQAEVKGAQTEVARAMNAMKILRSATAESFHILDDVRRTVGGKWGNDKFLAALAGMDDLAKINKLVRKTTGRRINDIGIEVYINGLLSGPKTLAVNVLSNSFKAVETLIERPLVAGVGLVRQGVMKAVGKEAAPRAHAREAVAMMMGSFEGFLDATRIPLMEMAKSSPSKWKELKYGTMWRSAAEERPIMDAQSALEGNARKAIHIENAETLGAKGVNLLGQLIRLPSRGIMVTDELFKTMAYRTELRALAYRNALESADKLGLSGAKRSKHVAGEIDKILRDPPEDIALEAQNFMRYQTFQSELGQLGKKLQGLSANHTFFTVVMPFVRTPLNIFKQGLERSPLAWLNADFYRALGKGGVHADKALARLTMGTGTALGFWWMAAQGQITGGGKMGAQKNTERLSDIPPYSMKIGETWYQYNRLDPWGMVMGMAADSFDFYKNDMAPHQFADERENPAMQVLAGSILIASKNAFSKTWAKGVMDITNVMADPDRYAQGYVNSTVSSFMPYSSLLRGINKEVDPTAREAFTFVETLKRNTPGLSDELPGKRDWLGDEVPNRGDIINPVVSAEESADPLRKELARLRFSYDMPDKEMDGVPLTSKQYTRFLEIRGKEVRDGTGHNMQEALREFIKTPEYAMYSDGDGEISNGKAIAIKKFISAYNKGAKAQLLEEDKDLYERVLASKQALAESKFEAGE